MTESEQVDKIKSIFGNYMFEKPEWISKHKNAREVILIYSIFHYLLDELKEPKFPHKNLENIFSLNEVGHFTMIFKTNDQINQLIIKGVLIEDENIFSINLLKKFGKEELLSVDLPLILKNDLN